MTTFYLEYQKIFVSVDCIIFGFDENKLKVLIGKRKMDPGRGEWSLYGGFVRIDESVDDAAHRTLYELTGMKNVSIAYYALINVKDYDNRLLEEHGVEWVDLESLPPLYSDHREMVDRARKLMKEKIKTNPVGFTLLPQLFTLTQLQRLYEAVNGETLDKRNFRKRVKEMDFIEKTELIDKVTSKRGASLYRFNKKAYNEESNFKL